MSRELVERAMHGDPDALGEDAERVPHVTLHHVVAAGQRLLASGWHAEPGVEQQVPATWVSSDGVDWERIPDPAPSWVVVAGDGLLVGAAEETTGADESVTFMRSADGLTWTVADVQPEMERVSAATASPDGEAVFLGPIQGKPQADGSPTFDVQAWTTRDGVSWSGAIAAENATVRGVAAGNGGFVAVGSRPGVVEGTALDIGVVWTSTDGLSWQEQGSGFGIEESTMTGVFRIGEVLVAVAECCGGDAVLRPTAWVSEDGIDWRFVPHQPAFAGWEIQVHGVVEIPDGLLAVGRRWDQDSNHPLPQAWIASDLPMVWQLPATQPGADVGDERPFEMGHCGLRSPIDFDGSMWAPIDSDPSSLEFDMASGTITLTDTDRARFVSDAGESVTLARIDGGAAYPLCD